MSDEKKAAAFGQLVLGAMDEIRAMEARLPEGFGVDEMVHVIKTADGESWKIIVARPSEDDE